MKNFECIQTAIAAEVQLTTGEMIMLTANHPSKKDLESLVEIEKSKTGDPIVNSLVYIFGINEKTFIEKMQATQVAKIYKWYWEEVNQGIIAVPPGSAKK